MYEIFKNVIESKRYSLDDMLKRLILFGCRETSRRNREKNS